MPRGWPRAGRLGGGGVWAEVTNVPLVGAAAVEGRVRAQTGGADAVFCGRGCGTVVAPRRFSFWTHRVPLAHGDTALDMTGLSGESSVGLLPWATHCWRKGLAGEWGGALPGLAGIVLVVRERNLSRWLEVDGNSAWVPERGPGIVGMVAAKGFQNLRGPRD